MSLPLRPFLAMLACLALSACVTTGDAERSVDQRWTGQPVDRFFAAYGPPASTYKLSGGAVIYTWRGGRIDKHLPADYEIVRRDPFYDPMFGPRFGPYGRPWFGEPDLVMVSPARDVRLQCEAQITTDRSRIIRSIRISADTEGEGLSQSRCAEVFGVKDPR